ncbi:hypothetical protein LCGC14_1413650 [marine sediment metagenome]|uniref:Glycosyltransferase 2-like domain-containing protein n=1 Tax=marine sediment metagenome TaxID=412755 RepID=A0A0F9JTG3_9ZZZZ
MLENAKVDVIIPSWENNRMLEIAENSIKQNTTVDINFFKQDNSFNKGWMGFCNEGIKASLETDSKYVLLSNDDIVVSPTSDWARTMICIMDKYPTIGSIGPLSNMAMGWAGIDQLRTKDVEFTRVPYISHFFVFLRKDTIRKVGLLDTTLSGGDDLDYCFRLDQSDYMIAVTPKVFVWHHYAQTGKKMYSQWDTEEYTRKIAKGLIDKHGFKKYIYGMTGFHTGDKTWS